MYYGKKKAIMIAVIIAIISVVLIVGGLFLFLATDLFKSADVLFYQKMVKSVEQLDGFKMDNLAKILEAKGTESYDTKSQLEIINDDNTLAKMDIVSKNDIENDKRFLNLKTSNNNELTDITYVRSNDILALKWEEVVKTYYVGIKNENLKVFAQKLGITDTSSIPDSIDLEFLNNMYKMSDEEIKHISEIYLKVIKDSIPGDCFTKQDGMSIFHNNVEVQATAYRVDLKQSDLRDLFINMLETLKEDSITLNILASDFSAANLNNYSSVDQLVKQIDTLIDKLNKEQTDDSKGLSIILYEDKGKIVQTEILFINEMKITLDFDINGQNNKLQVVIENFSDNLDYDTLKFEITNQALVDGSLNTIKYIADEDNKTEISISINGSIDDTVNTSILCEVNDEIIISYEAETVFGSLNDKIEDLDANKNCIVLNNYNQAQLQNVLTQIANQAVIVINEKIQKISKNTVNIFNQSFGDLNSEMVEAFNSKFDGFEGNLKGTVVKALIDLVKSNNSYDTRKVEMTINGLDYNIVDKSKIITTDSYNVKNEYDSEGFISKIIVTK